MAFWKKKTKEKKVARHSFAAYPHLDVLRPKERYVFRSDYFEVDTYVACILNFFHREGAADNFGPFYGINKIPGGLPPGVTTINLEQVSRMGEKWISDRQTQAEKISDANENAQNQSGSNKAKHLAQSAQGDLEIIARELNDGASYLYVQSRLMVKAPNVELLDLSLDKITRLFLDRFGTVWAAPYTGNQRRELSDIFRSNKNKYGKGLYLTSTEYAGSHYLVTHGLEDAAGEYVGDMVGDVNNSAVLFDVNRYRHHVVVASEQINKNRNRCYVSDMWASKLGQAAMMNNHRVIHLILDGVNMDDLGPVFSKITSRIDLNKGDVNMFEMFGTHDRELDIYPAHMQKLILMAEQAYETTDADRSIIRGSLEDIATKYYIDQRMWHPNPGLNRDKLRIVGIPHEEVPKLQGFSAYLDMEYQAIVNQESRDEERVHALSILSTTFKNLLSNNGDLFNTITSNAIDEAVKAKRVLYDFSRLMLRGKGVAMAQLVNIIGFAVGNLGHGDVVVIHGAENIDSSVRAYINTQFDFLYKNGGRVVFCYNNIEKMLNDQSFNGFDKADYTVLGNMSDNTVLRYQKALGQTIPPDLAKLIVGNNSGVCYIRRGFDNVVFTQNLQLEPLTKTVVGTSKFTRRRELLGGAK